MTIGVGGGFEVPTGPSPGQEGPTTPRGATDSHDDRLHGLGRRTPKPQDLPDPTKPRTRARYPLHNLIFEIRTDLAGRWTRWRGQRDRST